MDKLEHYRQAVQTLLERYSQFGGQNDNIERDCKLVCVRGQNRI